PKEMLKMEKDLLGLYISSHPLDQLKDSLEGQVKNTIAEVLEKHEGDSVVIGGLISGSRKINTKKGDLMMVTNLEDLTASISLVIFPKAYAKYQSMLFDEAIVVIKGKMNRDARTDELNVLVDSVDQLAELEKVRSLHIEIIDVKDKQVLERLKELLLFYKGDEPVILYYEGKRISAGSKYRVDINTDLVNQIEELLGTGSANVVFNHIKKEEEENVK
ncbi:MAG: OB-fold nucleic acid binding domain-containing protein, partial [Candidatus Margulisiibacteriota bacterium]